MKMVNANNECAKESCRTVVSVDMLSRLSDCVSRIDGLATYVNNKLSPIMHEERPQQAPNVSDCPRKSYPPFFEELFDKITVLNRHIDSIQDDIDRVEF
jgi:hypothetical protein